MNLTAYFTNNGIPATDKNPTITVWDITNQTPVINSAEMTEIAGGFYVYNFGGYDYTKDYVIQAYESTLPDSEKYVVATNDSDSQNTQGVLKQILGMVQSNFRMVNQEYDTSGRLTRANIYTYSTPSDLVSDIPLHSYLIEADYDGSGNLVDYVVTDI